MKKIILLSVLVLNINLFSQTYVLDNNFGDLGTKKYNKNIHVKNGLLVNTYYYFISNNSIAKVDYSGQIVTAYGDNGVKLLQQTNEILTISNFIYYNNYFYVYGSVKNNTTNNIDIYISKIDESGNYDTNFGANGILKLDFGLQESISSLLIEPSGNLYCIGTRNNQNIYNTGRLILFKIYNVGTVNTLFSPDGFKEIAFNLSTSGAEIISYNSEYMLLGTSTEYDGAYNRTKIMITEVDNDGNINTLFGINGFKTIPLADQGIYYNTIKSVKLLDTTLYINMNQGGAVLGDNNNNLLIYNLVNDQVVSSINHGEFFYNQVTDNGVFLTSYCSSCCGTNNYACDNTFELRKINFEGTTDNTFHINGLYSYEFAYSEVPNEPNQGDSRSYVFIKEPNGKILIAGFVYKMFSTPGFSAIRIIEGALGLNNTEGDIINTIYPNPFNDKIIFTNASEIKKIEIYDLSGRKILDTLFKHENNDTTIDVSKINENGVYLIKITTENNKVVIKKIVKN